MKVKISLFLCLLLGLFLAACGGGGGGSASVKKLLSRVATEGTGERTFLYDSKNRLIADSALGEGNKIEYQGNGTRPSLVTNGTPYPTKEVYDASGNSVLIPIVYVQYQYGSDNLDGATTSYSQIQSLNQDKTPIAPGIFYRYFLNSSDRVIAYGDYGAVAGSFYPSGFSLTPTYDKRGNLLKKTRSIILMGTIINTWEYTYDDKKSPASGMTMPVWWFDDGAHDSFATDRIPGNCGSTLGFIGTALSSDDALADPNNPLSCVSTRRFRDAVLSRETETYSYTYDGDGYPTAVDVTRTVLDNEGNEKTTKYRKTFEYISAH
ncbi:MAG: hypothetical protein FWF41_00580 [Betaproteobacteria bacterium]|nr:hypothetical protein [Betaproteobacteria bacterium]